MDGTIVFIFLLDHLPESIINKTLETVNVTHTEYSGVNECDYQITYVTDPLLQIISRELQVLMIPKWLTNEKTRNESPRRNRFRTSERVNTSKAINYDENYEKFIKNNKVIESSVETDRKVDRKLKHFNEYDTNDEDERMPVKAPMMAAIFESLSNETAQTCAGALVAPQWVLTAASCVNLLRNFNANSTNTTEKSVYTVIINATDPLIDGSVHNVTEVLLHPNNETSGAITRRIGRNAVVALMKIEPPAALDEPPVFVSREDSSQYVTVYGWTMNKTEPDFETLYQTAFEALILSPEDCSTHYDINENTSEICLATTDDYAKVISHLSWGGPVVSHKGGIVGVSRGDSLAGLAAWPLVAHIDWIHTTALHTRDHYNWKS